MSTAEERHWQLLVAQLDRMERKIERSLTREEFEAYKREVRDETEKISEDIEEIRAAAVSPDQVTRMVGEGLRESEARGITTTDRRVRYGLGILSVGTFAILLLTTILDHV